MTLIQDLRLKLETLERYVDEALASTTESVSEYTLLSQLRAQEPLAWLGKNANNHSLFQNHFMLMHVLYRLQLRYWQEQSGHLELSALSIQRHPYGASLAGLQVADPLRSYYLDLNNLQQTSAEEVDEMLGGFWQRYLAGEGRADALAVLGLEAGADRKQIEQQYRRLASKHHPDRGGDDRQLAEINKAVEILRRCVPA